MTYFKILVTVFAVTLLTGVGFAEPPKTFEVTPGFKIEKGFVVTPPMAVPTAPVPSAKEATNADPLWFACRVVLDRGNGVGSSGSGTPISCENGKTVIVTNAHVVPKHLANRPITVHVGGRKFAATYVEGSEVDEYTNTDGQPAVRIHGPDLAFLTVDAELGHVEIADDAPPVGAQVWQFGYGGTQSAEGPTTKSGLVHKSTFTEPTLVTDLTAVSGDSGAGLFNTRGELCGVTWGTSSVTRTSYAVEVGTVRRFAGRPLLAKLFPRLAARAEAKRSVREALRLPPPMAKAPEVPRKGTIDPKLVKPGADAPPTSKPPAAPAKPPESVPQAPFGSGIPPKPPGDGWQWDENRRIWWKFVTPSLNAPRTLPPAFQSPFDPSSGGCPNGQCPLPQAPSRGRWR